MCPALTICLPFSALHVELLLLLIEITSDGVGGGRKSRSRHVLDSAIDLNKHSDRLCAVFPSAAKSGALFSLAGAGSNPLSLFRARAQREIDCGRAIPPACSIEEKSHSRRHRRRSVMT